MYAAPGLMQVDAILLDRDGTLNAERADYVKSWEEFVFLPGALEALALLARLRVPVAVITNQSCVGRGIVPRRHLDEIHQRMLAQVQQAGGRIDAVYVCPHRPDEGCACRKPAPGLLRQAASDFDVDPARCVYIGDAPTDLEAAQRAGCRALMVASGLRAEMLRDRKAHGDSTPLFTDLSEAAAWLSANAMWPANRQSPAGGGPTILSGSGLFSGGAAGFVAQPLSMKVRDRDDG